MILLKIAMVGIAIAALMGAARDQRWFERARVVGACYATPAPLAQQDDAWYVCREGILSGFPNLAANSCSSEGVVSHQEIWRCTAPLASLPGG